MRLLSLKAALTVMALFVTACTSPTSSAPFSEPRAMPVTTTDTSLSQGSTSVTRDPQVIVDALDAAGLALCHSYLSDGAEYNIYGILGASATWRFFPHHTAERVPSVNGDDLSCVTPNQSNTGVIEIDVYPHGADASAALRQAGRLWLYAWLDGNVAIHVDQSTPPPVADVAREVLEHLPGTTRVP